MPCMQNQKEEEGFVSEEDGMLVLSVEFVCKLLWAQLVVSLVCVCTCVHTPFLSVIEQAFSFSAPAKEWRGEQSQSVSGVGLEQ